MTDEAFARAESGSVDTLPDGIVFERLAIRVIRTATPTGDGVDPVIDRRP